MKKIGIIALLLAITVGSTWAQEKKPDRRPTPTAEGVPNSKAGTSDHMDAADKRTKPARPQSGTGNVGSLSGSATSEKRSKPKVVNQAAAGVPPVGNRAVGTRDTNRSNRNQ